MHRTTTAGKSVIQLPEPLSATFPFGATDHTVIITIPSTATWRPPPHWQFTDLDTQRVECLEGQMWIQKVARDDLRQVKTTFGGPGLEETFDLNYSMAWGPSSKEPPRLVVGLIADQKLHRNIASAIVDRAVFARLSSTPLWFRALFRAFPSYQTRLLDAALRIQLTLIYYAHGYRMDHGHIPFSLLWIITYSHDEIPAWVDRWELVSRNWISAFAMGSRYWLGRLFLGMKAEYKEYTPSPS